MDYFNIVRFCLFLWIVERELRVKGGPWVDALAHGFVLEACKEFRATGTRLRHWAISASLAFFKSKFHLRKVFLDYLCTLGHASTLHILTNAVHFILSSRVKFLLRFLVILLDVIDVLLSAYNLRSI